MLHFAPFLSTPFEEYALNPFSLSPHFCPNIKFAAVWSFFLFEESVGIEPRITFYVFCPAEPKIKPYNQTPRPPVTPKPPQTPPKTPNT